MKSILFNTPMIEAILAGYKTQTRRIIRVAPDIELEKCENANALRYYSTMRNEEVVLIPKYKLGDVLWVRETCLKNGMDEQTGWCP